MMQFIKDYLKKTPHMENLFVLLDSRHKPQESDLKFMEWLGMNQIPFTMVFTKIDKLSSSHVSKNMAKYRDEMLKTWEFLPKVIKTSAVSRQGKKEILDYIEEIIQTIKN
jgi:GTP-binding protein